MCSPRHFFSFAVFLIIGIAAKPQDLMPDENFNPADITNAKLLAVNKKQKNISFTSALNLFVLLSPDCPLCKNYSLTLNKIEKEFSKELSVYGIVPGKAYSTKEVQQYIRDYKISFPIYIDSQKELTTYIKGTVTPEAILINNQGVIIYRGAIDDWVQQLGKKKLRPGELYLENAINQYLKGEPITQTRTIPKGCLINEF